LTSPHTNGVPRKGTLMQVGFHKRECQVKALFLFREEGRFLTSSPHPQMHEPWLGRGWARKVQIMAFQPW
jgi:hypothetical protein